MTRKLIDSLTDVPPSADCAEDEASHPAEPEATLPDEELVFDLLADRDGHTWQGEIASMLDWSAPKTSRLLTELEELNAITRYRVGRRKVVCLPHQEPQGLKKWGSHSAEP